jgi:protein SCO1/2
VLFVTVDPNRDTLAMLKDYTGSFAPQVVGLRGTPDQLATLAKRYRVSYSVERRADGHGFDVTHGAAVYVFGRDGNVKLLFSGLALQKVDTAPQVADLRELVGQSGATNWWRRLVGWL